MAAKALITEWTWRKPEAQRAALARIIPGWPDVPIFSGEDRHMLLRATTRKEPDTIYVASLGCVASDEDDLIDFLRAAKKRALKIICIEEDFEWYPQRSLSIVLKAWKAARNKGSAKVGGQISGEMRKAIVQAGAEKIRARWALPSKEWKTDALLKEADISRTSANKYLGRRPLTQANYIAAQKRKAKREAQNEQRI